MSMTSVWLVDVDGTVLDKDKMWQQLEVIFHATFPDLTINFRKYYNEHRGENHSVGSVIEAMQRDFGINEAKFLDMFRQVDYEQCFEKEVWQRLTEQAEKEGAKLAFFTEGYVPVQEIKKEKLQRIVGEGIRWHIHEPGKKMDELRNVIQEYWENGERVDRLIDDMEINRKRAEQECGLRTAERL